jgi:TatD DNase family protein
VIVDSHCHLDYPGLAEREAEVIENARRTGVGMVVHIAAKREGWPAGIALAERHPEVLCAVGVHPHEAGAEGLDDPGPLLALALHPRVVAIGESGLDYFYDLSPRDRQAASFRAHVRASQTTGLPLVVHTRDADDDTMAILEQGMEEAPFTGVVHCYSSSRRLAERAVAAGLSLGLGGILTFKRSDELRATVRDMPLDRLLLETDAPYLAPVPVRGRTNEPAYAAHVARVLAEVKGLGVAEIERATTDNFFRLFAKARPPRAAAAPVAA